MAGIAVSFDAGSTGKMIPTREGVTVMRSNATRHGICELEERRPTLDGASNYVFFNAGRSDAAEVMHKRAGHIAVRTLQHMERIGAADGLDEL